MEVPLLDYDMRRAVTEPVRKQAKEPPIAILTKCMDLSVLSARQAGHGWMVLVTFDSQK